MESDASPQNPHSRLSPAFWILLALGLVVCGLSFYLDQSVIGWVQAHSLKSVVRFAGYVSYFGDWPELMAYGLVGLGITSLVRNRRVRRVIFYMMIAGTLSGAFVNSIRVLSGRARPSNTEARQEWNGGWHKGELLLFKNKYHAFPSGHTGTAFAFFGGAAFSRKPFGWFYLIPAALIGWSRIQVNAHHLSDVLTGMTIGLIVAYLTVRKSQSAKHESDTT
jgi:membrane-associated phospholipid phosphatase